MSINDPVTKARACRVALCSPRSFLTALTPLAAYAVIALGALSATAEERNALRVNAPIVAVEALTSGALKVCDQPAPPQSEGLVAALRWDLYERCRMDEAASVVTGYRVDYQWDGQRFSMVMQSRPTGDTIPLTLHID